MSLAALIRAGVWWRRLKAHRVDAGLSALCVEKNLREGLLRVQNMSKMFTSSSRKPRNRVRRRVQSKLNISWGLGNCQYSSAILPLISSVSPCLLLKYIIQYLWLWFHGHVMCELNSTRQDHSKRFECSESSYRVIFWTAPPLWRVDAGSQSATSVQCWRDGRQVHWGNSRVGLVLPTSWICIESVRSNLDRSESFLFRSSGKEYHSQAGSTGPTQKKYWTSD